MEYLLQHVLTEREYAKLVVLLARKDAKIRSAPPQKVIEVRGFVRLFIKSWAAAFALKKLTKRQFNPTKLSTVIVACALSYRVVFRLLNGERLLSDKLAAKPASKLAAPLSGLVAGSVLANGLSPNVASYVAIYIASKVCEWLYNTGNDEHKFDWKPQFLGTWALFPFAYAQLFQSFILSPESCPNGFKRLLTALSNGALEERSQPNDVVVAIADTSINHFPEFRSALVYQSRVTTNRLVLKAHPGNSSMVGAILHPQSDSDLQFFLNSVGSNMSLILRWLVPIYLIRAYLGRKSFKEALSSALRVAVTYSMTTASSIAGIRLSETLLGRKLSPRLRFSIIGFLSGLWAILNQENGRAQFLYAARLALLSLIPPHTHGRVAQVLLPVSMASAFMLLNSHPEAVTQRIWKKIGHWMQYGRWTESIDDSESDSSASNSAESSSVDIYSLKEDGLSSEETNARYD